MKKPKLLQLALSLAMLIAIPTTNSFANTKTKFAPIADASQMNMAAVNNLSAVKTGGGFTVPIGTIIPWSSNESPSDEICSDLSAGGNGSFGICKWLECNGQTVNPTIYTEYAKITSKTPNFDGYMLKGRENGRNSGEAYTHDTMYLNTNFSAEVSWNGSPNKHLDGVVGIRSGINRDGITPPPGTKYTTHKWTAKGWIYSIPVRYLIRVSN